VEDRNPQELLKTLASSGELAGFRGLVEPLEEYDRERKGDLIRTLAVFFEANANASEAAETLYLHRNSMAYRLERIQEITALDLKSPENRLALQLGLLATNAERSER
jgi:DNA-binding PucR family transcriptional regulator